MSIDIDAVIATMTNKGVSCSDIDDESWGRLTELVLPGGGTLGVYQPHHARPNG
jgi:hypothetical protein